MRYVRERHPEVPVVYYANGGSSYLELQARPAPPSLGDHEMAASPDGGPTEPIAARWRLCAD